MKALSIHPYYAMAIVAGQKYAECRTWSTDYRGDLLICSTAKKYHGTIPGHALGVVTLEDVVPFRREHLEPALMTAREYRRGMFAWVLSNNRLIKPVPVKGRLSLWDYDGGIEYLPITDDMVCPEGVSVEDAGPGQWFHDYWEPLMT